MFEYAQRQAPSTTDDELWSMKIVRMKVGHPHAETGTDADKLMPAGRRQRGNFRGN